MEMGHRSQIACDVREHLLVLFHRTQTDRSSASDPELRANAAKAALLNGLSALFALALDALVHPFTLNSERGFFARNLGLLYTLLWLAPLAAASLWFNVCSTFWTLPTAQADRIRRALGLPPSHEDLTPYAMAQRPSFLRPHQRATPIFSCCTHSRRPPTASQC